MSVKCLAIVFMLRCLLAGDHTVRAEDDRKPSEYPAPRKQGKWEVTPVGTVRRWLSHYFADQHRLLVVVDEQPPQLWDTQTGKRVAVLSEQKRGAGSWALTADGSSLLTADDLGGSFFRPAESEKVIRSLWLWELATGKLAKRFDVDLSADELRGSTEWHIVRMEATRALIQLGRYQGHHKGSAPDDLASAAPERTVLGYLDLKTGKVGDWSKAFPEGLRHVRCSPDGKRAVEGQEDGVERTTDGSVIEHGWVSRVNPRLIDLRDFKEIAMLHEGAKPHVLRTIWSPDSHWIATVGSDRVVRVTRAEDGKAVSEMTGHDDRILDAAFSPDGRTLATVSEDETARLWDVASGKQLHSLGHTAGLNSAMFDRKGERIVTASEDETARLWDVASGKQLRVWDKHEGPVRDVGFEAENKRVWTHTARGVRRVWSVEDGSLVSEKMMSEKWPRCGVLYLLKKNGRSDEIWCGPRGVPGEDDDDEVHPKGPQPRLTIRMRSSNWALALAPDGKSIATSASLCDGAYVWDLQRWDKLTGQGRTLLAENTGFVSALAFAPDGKSLAIASQDGRTPGGPAVVRLWDLATRKETIKLEGSRRDITSLTFSPDGEMLAAGSRNDAIQLWRVPTGKVYTSIVDVTGSISAVAFSPDGRLLASAGKAKDSKDGEVNLWEVATVKTRKTLKGLKSEPSMLAFTADGKTLLANDHGINAWDLAKEKPRANFQGAYFALSPDCKLLATGILEWNEKSEGPLQFAWGGSYVALWDFTTGEEIGRFRAHAGEFLREPTCMVFTPDGRTLITVDLTGAVKFWDVADLRRKLGKE